MSSHRAYVARSLGLIYLVAIVTIIIRWNAAGWTGMYVAAPSSFSGLIPLIFNDGPAERIGVKRTPVEAMYPVRRSGHYLSRIDIDDAGPGDLMLVRQGGHELLVPIETPLGNEALQTRTVLVVATSAAIFALALAIFAGPGASPATRTAGRVCVLLAVWLFSANQLVCELARGVAVGVSSTAHIWQTMAMVSLILIPAALLHFAATLLPGGISPRVTIVLYLPVSMLFLWNIPGVIEVMAILLTSATLVPYEVSTLAGAATSAALYLRVSRRLRPWRVVVGYAAAAAALCFLVAFLSLLVTRKYEHGLYLVWAILTLLYLLVVPAIAFALLVRSVRQATNRTRRSLAWPTITAAVLSAGLLILATDSISLRYLPNHLSHFGLTVIACAIAAALPWSLAVAINRHGLLGLPPLFARYTAITAFTISLVFVESLWEAATAVLSHFGIRLWESHWVHVAIAAVITVVKTRPSMHKLIYVIGAVPHEPERPVIDEALLHVISEISNAPSRGAAAELAGRALSAAVESDVVAVFEPVRKRWTPLWAVGLKKSKYPPVEHGRPPRRARDPVTIWPVSDLARAEQEPLQELGAELVATCWNGKRPTAMLLIGARRDGAPRAASDAHAAIETIASVLALRLRRP